MFKDLTKNYCWNDFINSIPKIDIFLLYLSIKLKNIY